MSDFDVQGADQFYRLSKALKHAGRSELRKELNKRIRQAAKPLIADVRAAALTELPKAGGLNERMAKRPVRIATRTGADPGVKLVMAKTQPGYNDGVIRHPVFERNKAGRKGAKARGEKPTKWVTQRIGPGHWFDDTIVDNKATVIDALEQAVQSVADQVVREAGLRSG